MPAFEIGNKHAAKAKLFYGAMMRSITQDDGARLRKTAETVLTKAAKGEPWAVMLLRDTLDGKPMQQVEARVDAKVEAPDEIESTRLIALALKLGMARLAEGAETLEPVTVSPALPDPAE